MGGGAGASRLPVPHRVSYPSTPYVWQGCDPRAPPVLCTVAVVSASIVASVVGTGLPVPYHHGSGSIDIGIVASLYCNSVNIAIRYSSSDCIMSVTCSRVQVIHVVTVGTVGDNTAAASVGRQHHLSPADNTKSRHAASIFSQSLLNKEHVCQSFHPNWNVYGRMYTQQSQSLKGLLGATSPPVLLRACTQDGMTLGV